MNKPQQPSQNDKIRQLILETMKNLQARREQSTLFRLSQFFSVGPAASRRRDQPLIDKLIRADSPPLETTLEHLEKIKTNSVDSSYCLVRSAYAALGLAEIFNLLTDSSRIHAISVQAIGFNGFAIHQERLIDLLKVYAQNPKTVSAINSDIRKDPHTPSVYVIHRINNAIENLQDTSPRKSDIELSPIRGKLAPLILSLD